MLEKVKDRLGDNDRVDYRRLGLEQLDKLPDYGCFDSAVAVRVVPHAADWRAGLERLVGALRPGGLAVFDLWSRQSFVGGLMRLTPQAEPAVVHRLTRREIRAAMGSLTAEVVAAYRWGYPRIGPIHLDDLGSVFFPSWAYSTLFCVRKTPYQAR
jgi:SAM-dependent methyltransferase